MRPSSSIMVVTSCRCGTLPIVTGAVGEQRAREDRQRRVLGAGDAHLAVERHAAADLQLVHARAPVSAGRGCARPPIPPACRPAIDSAWISPPMRAPSARVDELVALRSAACPRTAAATTTRREMRVVVGRDADRARRAGRPRSAGVTSSAVMAGIAEAGLQADAPVSDAGPGGRYDRSRDHARRRRRASRPDVEH